MSRRIAALARVASALTALALLAVATATAQEPGSVTLTSPRPDAPVFGRIAIEAAVTPPPGAKTLKVEFFVDGRLIATVLDPPWRADWDAGEGVESHTLRARAYTSDGRVITVEQATIPRVGVESARVLLVEVYATVKTEDHFFVKDLKREAFTVKEDGRPQTLSLFTQERKPVQVVLLVDVSASMRKDEKLVKAIEAAKLFLEALDPSDRVAVVAFSDTVKELQPFTSDRAAANGAIADLQPLRGTALYDAIYAAADLVGKEEGRRALVLLSDGQDLSYDGMGPGSGRTLEEAIEEALRQQVTAFTIGIGENLETDYDFNRRHSAQEVLTRLAADTGGQYLPVARPGKLKGAFDRILDELRFQYTLAYHPTNDRRDGTWRSIGVTVARPRAIVTARKGYFAPTD